MVWAEVLWGLITLLLVMDARRISARLASIPVLCLDEADADDSVEWVLAPGVELPTHTADSALTHMRAHGLSALELLPANLPLSMLWSLGYHVDPNALRNDPRKQGESGAHAFVAPKSVLKEMGFKAPVRDLATFVSLSREVRRRVDGKHDLVIAPG